MHEFLVHFSGAVSFSLLFCGQAKSRYNIVIRLNTAMQAIGIAV